MIKEFTITYSRTVNLGDYNSAKVEYSEIVVVPKFETANIKQIRDAAYKRVKSYVDSKIKNLLKDVI